MNQLKKFNFLKTFIELPKIFFLSQSKLFLQLLLDQYFIPSKGFSRLLLHSETIYTYCQPPLVIPYPRCQENRKKKL